ncbi:MAG: hypothetical protein IJT02_05400 [Synergistaceae bacterium]|nr:hypothetical protein [Synergistaceae bacterium]
MTRKIAVLAVIAVMLTCGSSEAAKKKVPAVTYTPREIPSSMLLPPFKNPVEADLRKSKLHISFKGAFRGIDKEGEPNDWVYLAFIARPQKDMYLAVGQSELFDGTGRRYMYRSIPKIGSEHVFGRNIVGGVAVPVLVGVNMPIAEAGDLPSIARVTVTFSGETLEFRNVQSEEGYIWEEVRDTEGTLDDEQ